jgi:hypothetical protein
MFTLSWVFIILNCGLEGRLESVIWRRLLFHSSWKDVRKLSIKWFELRLVLLLSHFILLSNSLVIYFLIWFALHIFSFLNLCLLLEVTVVFIVSIYGFLRYFIWTQNVYCCCFFTHIFGFFYFLANLKLH